jgi:restriction system protein
VVSIGAGTGRICASCATGKKVDAETARRILNAARTNPALAFTLDRCLREGLIAPGDLSALGDFQRAGLVGPNGKPLSPDSAEYRQIVTDISGANDRIIEMLKSDPQQMRLLSSRKFEEIIAEILKRQSYDVVLTPPSRDGGLDIRAVRHESLGCFLYLVECKRYTPPNKVGVGIVRALNGVLEERKATAAMVVSSSYFTSDAMEFQERLPHRLSLHDYVAVQNWLKQI